MGCGNIIWEWFILRGTGLCSVWLLIINYRIPWNVQCFCAVVCRTAGFRGLRSAAGLDPEFHTERQHNVWSGEERGLVSVCGGGMCPSAWPGDPSCWRRDRDRREGINSVYMLSGTNVGYLLKLSAFQIGLAGWRAAKWWILLHKVTCIQCIRSSNVSLMYLFIIPVQNHF